MDIKDLIRPEHVIAKLRVEDKATLLYELAGRASRGTGIDAKRIADALASRERLGSTGIGRGIAVPHAVVDGLEGFFALFARLDRPIDFAAVDAEPVDLVFLLLTPANVETEHLSALACVSRQLRDTVVAQRLRTAKSAAELYEIITSPTRERLARPHGRGRT